MWGPYLPDLARPAQEQREKVERVKRILDAFHTAKQSFGMMEWVMLPGDTEWRKLAEAVEPMLAEAERRADAAEQDGGVPVSYPR